MSVLARPKGRTWRRDTYEYLADRDGAVCAQCRASERTIWRNNGMSNNGDWESEPEYFNLMSWVYPTSNLEIDHKVPLHCGGTNEEDNLWLLCIECHKAKTIQERKDRAKART